MFCFELLGVLLVRIYFLWEELLVVLVGGRLYTLAHGVWQKVAHLGVAAGAAVWGVDVVEGTLLDAGGQWCGKAASLALGGGGAVGGSSGSDGDGVNHERAVFAGGPGCLGAGIVHIEALSFLVSLVRQCPLCVIKRRICLAEPDHPANSVTPAGRKLSPQAAAAMS